jgi:DNA processing protein
VSAPAPAAGGPGGPATPDVEAARHARVALGWLVEPGSRALWSRVVEHGPAAVLDGLLGGDPVLRQAAGARLGTADPRSAADAALARIRRLGGRVVVPEDAEWPPQLDHLIRICRPASKDPVDRDAAPPLCLWVRGAWRVDEALERSVAVVGARAATGYGAHVARQVGYGLAERDWTVVSGGAFGIDAYAHRGTLAAGGCTVVVLACGVDRAYPASHASLFEQVVETGLLVSEWPPGAEPFRHRFLIRNRVIAAATRGTVVVEAGARSGALQTLRRAGELGRCRMVVPGPVTSAISVGCHEQLRDPEVRLVTGVPHILEEVGRIGADLAPAARGPEHARDRLEPAERRLLEALLIRKPLSSELAAARAGVPTADAMRILPSLVLRGFAVRREHGFVIAPGPPVPATPGGLASPDGAAA